MLKRLHPALLSLLLLVELPFLGSRPLGRDEATSVEAAGRHAGAFWQLLGHLDAPLGLYYLLLRPVVRLSDGAFAVRLPSLLGAVVAVAILALTVERRFGRRAGTWSALAMLANPGLWLFADLARPYALALAFASVTLYILLVSPERAALYGVAALLTLYLQLLFALFLAAQAVLMLRERQYRLVAALALAAFATVPLAVVASGQQVMTSWIPLTSVDSVRSQAVAFYGEAGALTTGGAALSLVLALLGSRVAGARRVLLIGVVPAAVLVVAGLRMHVLGGRYALYAALALAASAGIGLARVTSRPVNAAVALVLGAATVLSAVHLARIDYFQEDLRSAARYLVAHGQSGDALLYEPDWARPGMQYWLDRTEGAAPDDVAVAAGTVPVATGNLFLPERGTSEIQAAVAGRSRVWVVGYPGSTWRPTRNTAGDVARELERTWVTTATVSYGEITLRLLAHAPVPG